MSVAFFMLLMMIMHIVLFIIVVVRSRRRHQEGKVGRRTSIRAQRDGFYSTTIVVKWLAMKTMDISSDNASR